MSRYLEAWRLPFLQAAGPVTALVSSAFGLGFALDQTVWVTLVGALVAFGIVFLLLRRSRGRQLGIGEHCSQVVPRLGSTKMLLAKQRKKREWGGVAAHSPFFYFLSNTFLVHPPPAPSR